MDAKRSPAYLRSTSDAVAAFRDALQRFLNLHVENTTVARGMLPAVFPRDDADPEEIKIVTTEVDLAAGRAGAAPALTGCLVNVQGVGAVDPIAPWRSIAAPKPILEPADIMSACGQMIGRLEQMILEAEAAAPPESGIEAMHPLVWGAARQLWRDGHLRQAVAAAAEALVTQVKFRTGRNDVADTALWQETLPSPKGSCAR